VLHGIIRRRLFEPVRRARAILREEGWRSLLFRAWRRLRGRASSDSRYAAWIARNEPGPEEVEAQRRECGSLAYRPKVSLIMPVWNPELRWLQRTIASVSDQTYDNWELCIADGGSTKAGVRETLDQCATRDPRIKVRFLTDNRGISGNSNEALALAVGEYVGLLDHDDDLAPFALFEVIKLLNADRSADFIYSDEDRVDVDGRRFLPFFKPDWSPDLLLSYMYTGHFTVYKRQLVLDCGGFRPEFDFSQDYDLALRASEKANRIIHIPKVLYHWRAAPGSAAGGGKGFARASNIAALASAVKRRGYDASARMIRPKWGNRIRYNLAEAPLISIVIPTDKRENAIQCVDSILRNTDYLSFEVILVANSGLADALHERYRDEPSVRTAAWDKPFNFSAKCNLGAASANGSYLLFLNDDVAVSRGDWLEEMVQLFRRPEVGAVGPKLVFPDNTIQHAGLATGGRGLVSSPFWRWPADSLLYFHYIQNTRNVSALSAACLLVPKRLFESVGGFDDVNTPIMHSDVDLCFRIRQKGYLLVYTPFATLTHRFHQSLGRGGSAHRDMADLYLLKKWPAYVSDDPYYTQNMREYLEGPSWHQRLVVNGGEATDRRGKSILLVTPDLSVNGMGRLAYDLAVYLRNRGNYVAALSPVDGDLAPRFMAEGIPVIESPSIFSDPLEQETRLVTSFDLIVTGVMALWKLLLTSKESGVPLVVLVHDSARLKKRLDEGDPDGAKLLGIADAVVFCSAREAAICGNRGSGNVEVISWREGSSDSVESEGLGTAEAFASSFAAMIARRLSLDLRGEDQE
jgi:GT2 family glycosyltransferase